jgi:hypothetical protein
VLGDIATPPCVSTPQLRLSHLPTPPFAFYFSLDIIFFSPCFHHQLLLNDSYPFHSDEYFETLPPMASGTHLQPHAMSFSGTGDWSVHQNSSLSLSIFECRSLDIRTSLDSAFSDSSCQPFHRRMPGVPCSRHTPAQSSLRGSVRQNCDDSTCLEQF